jgi:hypothetical protein
MTVSIAKELLLKQSFGVQEVEIEGLGSVTIRPLTRGEVLQLQVQAEKHEWDAAKQEQVLVSIGMVEPKLTEDEVKTWQDVSPADQMSVVVEAIQGASGVKADSSKEATKSLPE